MKRLLIFWSVLLFIGVSNAQVASRKVIQRYIDSIVEQRKEKNTEFMNDKDSPLPKEEKISFIGLHYFPPDYSYKVNATLTRFDNPVSFKMKTTTDRLPEYSLYGKVEFKIKGKKMQLNVYQNIDLLRKPGYDKYLFIPFNDATNGTDTYQGGRFMDAEIPESNMLILDFNTAYNPYCAYNHNYSCPIPPAENELPVRIEAGEKKWHE